MIDVFAVVVTDGHGVSLMHMPDNSAALFHTVPPAVVEMVARAQASNPNALYTICKLVPVDANPAMH